jgi:hypothetical protein
MAIKVQWDIDGPFAICDTTAEALELLKHARSSANSAGQRSKQEQSNEAPQTVDEKMAAIFAGVNKKAQKLLKALLVYPQGIEGDEFGKVCGTEPSGFGGVLGGISKEAKKVGLTIDKLVQSEARFDGPRRYRWLAPTKLLLEHKHQLQ